MYKVSVVAGKGEAAASQLVARIRRELARGTVELAVLSLLGTRPHYGYELLGELNRLTGETPQIKEGTLYPMLHRLEDAGVVSTQWQAEGREAPRKYYSLTPAGLEQLRVARAEWSRLVEGMARLLEQEAVK